MCDVADCGLTWLQDFVAVADFIDRGIKIAAQIKEACGEGHKVKDFKAHLATTAYPELDQLRSEVEAMSENFPLPGL